MKRVTQKEWQEKLIGGGAKNETLCAVFWGCRRLSVQRRRPAAGDVEQKDADNPKVGF